MALLSDWMAISARIRKVEVVARLYLDNLDQTRRGADALINPILANIQRLGEEIRSFSELNKADLGASEQAVIADYLNANRIARTEQPTYYMLLEEVIILCSFESELSYLMTDKAFMVRKATERAFIHLSRSLIVNSVLREQWIEAKQQGEPAVEKLGGVHLLSHGIWGFKCDAAGEKTDLVLSEALIDLQSVEKSADGLVLTEWKVLKDGSTPATAWDQAYIQAKIYGRGSLGAIELRDIRYLVLVSDDTICEPADRLDEGIIYRHVNIAISPSIPSRQRRGRLGGDY